MTLNYSSIYSDCHAVVTWKVGSRTKSRSFKKVYLAIEFAEENKGKIQIGRSTDDRLKWHVIAEYDYSNNPDI